MKSTKILFIVLLAVLLTVNQIVSQSKTNEQSEIEIKIINAIDSSLSNTKGKAGKFNMLIEFTNSSKFSQLLYSTRLKYTEQLLNFSNLPASDSTIMFHKLNVGLFNGYIGNYELSLTKLNEIIKKTSTTHLWRIHADALGATAYNYGFLNKNDLALSSAEKLLEESIAKNDLRYEYYARMFLGDLYRKIGKEEKSIPHYYRSDEIAELQNDNIKLDRTKSKIGKLLFLADEDSLSVIYHKKALRHAELINDKKRIYYLKSFIADLSPGTSFEEKIKTTKNYLDYIKKDNHLIDACRAYASIAENYYKINEYEQAQINAANGLKFGLKGNSYQNLFRCYMVLSKTKFIINEKDSSFIYLNNAKKYLNENASSSYKYYSFASELHYETGNYKTAYLLKNKAEEFFKISNDVQTQKKLAINFARYEFEKEKQNEFEIEKSKNEARVAERNFIIFSLLGITFTIMIALFYSHKISKERKLNLAEVNQKNIYIEEQKSELDDLNRMKDKFFSVIAHDLRGPVGNMMRLSKLVLLTSKEKNDEESTKIGSLLNESSKNIHSLLNSLLLWGKVQMNVAYAVKTKYLIYERVQDIIKIYQENIDASNIGLEINIDKSHSVYADEAMIDTVIRNLIHNAIKFCNGDGKIKVESYKVEKFVKISVTDNGFGIDKNVIEQVFGSNGKNGNLTNKKSGLGLILAKEFITLNDGEMDIESEIGKGTIVSFILPVYKTDFPVTEDIQRLV